MFNRLDYITSSSGTSEYIDDDSDYINRNGDNMNGPLSAPIIILTSALNPLQFFDGTYQSTAFSEDATFITSMKNDISTNTTNINTLSNTFSNTLTNISYDTSLNKTTISGSLFATNFSCANFNSTYLSGLTSNVQQQINDISNNPQNVSNKLTNLTYDTSENVTSVTGTLYSDIFTCGNFNSAYLTNIDADVQTQIDTAFNDISTNTYNISTNTTDISQNKIDISKNKLDISNNTTDISKNKLDISNNTTDISKNKLDISNNTTDISKNKLDISTNTADISQNKLDISTNTADISQNKLDISNNTADISKNKIDISTNTANIATNTANIATNTTNIATNTTNIATLTQKTQNITSSGLNNTTIAGSITTGNLYAGGVINTSTDITAGDQITCARLTVDAEDIMTTIDNAKSYATIFSFSNNELLNEDITILPPTTTYNATYTFISPNFVTTSSTFFNADGTLKPGKFSATLSFELTNFSSMKKLMVRYYILRRRLSDNTLVTTYSTMMHGFEEETAFHYSNYGGQVTGLFTISSSSSFEHTLIIVTDCNIYTSYDNGAVGISKFKAQLQMTEVF